MNVHNVTSKCSITHYYVRGVSFSIVSNYCNFILSRCLEFYRDSNSIGPVCIYHQC